MTQGSMDGVLPLQAEVRERSPSRRALRLLRPSPSVRADAPTLVEIFRVTDVALALVIVLGVLALVPAGRWSGAGGALDTPLRVLDVLLLGGFVAWWYAAFVLLGMYRSQRPARVSDELVAIAVSSALGTASLVPVLLIGGHSVGFVGAAAVWALACCAVLASRHLLRALWAAAGPRRSRRVLIVGSGPRAQDLLRQLHRDGAHGGRVIGHLDSTDASGSLAAPYLGRIEELEAVLMQNAVDAVLIALPIKSCYVEIQRTIEICERIGVMAEYPADVFRSDRGEPYLDPTRGRAVVALGYGLDDGRRRVKRALDIIGALAGLLILSPLFLVIALAIRITSGGPVLFVQQRCGRNRRHFPMFKFRTMVSNAEALQAEIEHLNEAGGPVFKIRLDPRVTPLGRFLRRTSLDELPQLLNVLRGEMSLVGPRPLPLRDVHRFSAAASMRRFSVRPGITCLWQINGRSDVHFDEWLTLDLQYIDRWSLLLDLRILMRTFPAVLRGVGAA